MLILPCLNVAECMALHALMKEMGEIVLKYIVPRVSWKLSAILNPELAFPRRFQSHITDVIVDQPVATMNFRDIMFPPNTRNLTIDANFFKIDADGVCLPDDETLFPFPEHTVSVRFTCKYFGALYTLFSLVNITSVEFSPYTKFHGNMLIPDTVTHLTLPGNNGPFVFPRHLKALRFPPEFEFSGPMTGLPISLEELHLPSRFNGDLNLSGYAALRSLNINGSFNGLLNLSGCTSMTKAEFPHAFNHEVSVDMLPPLLTHLTLGDNQRSPISSLPCSLLVLQIGNTFNDTLLIAWPPGLEELKFDVQLGIFDRHISPLPPSLKLLHMSCLMRNVPSAEGLVKLVLGRCFNFPIDFSETLRCLEELTFGYSFNHPISRDNGVSLLPRNLKKLFFGNDFDIEITEMGLPKNIQEIEFGYRFNSALSPNCFPGTVRRIRFGESFNRDLSYGTFPSTLKALEVHAVFRGQCPSSTRSLHVSRWRQT